MIFVATSKERNCRHCYAAHLDYDMLREHGLSQSEIVELVAMSGLAVYANIMADASAMSPDEMFASL